MAPLARNVGDVALMLDAMVGHHPEDPISLPAPAVPFIRAIDEPAMPDTWHGVQISELLHYILKYGRSVSVPSST